MPLTHFADFHRYRCDRGPRRAAVLALQREPVEGVGDQHVVVHQRRERQIVV